MANTDDVFKEDIKSFLRKELRRRREKNPRYSLRAFAKFLGVSDSFLSQVMRGKYLLSRPKLRQVGARLNVDAEFLERLERSLINERRRRKRKGFSRK